MKLPRIVIAGSESGVGKTTIAVGLMSALVKRGFKVQGFKVGPDFIDPTYHRAATGSPSRNLDMWMIGARNSQAIFCSAACRADISVIEGVMGLYDGAHAAGGEGSTAEAARLLGAPIILVVDASMLARSAAALVKGYAEFERGLRISGVIFNFVGGQGHFHLLKSAVEKYCSVPVLGYLSDDPRFRRPERHLGLVPAIENNNLGGYLSSLARECERTIDIDAIIRIAEGARQLSFSGLDFMAAKAQIAKIAVARDEAFSFYYQDNLDLLAALGAELIFFSPICDRKLPHDVDGLLFGGGFPEVYAEQLAENRTMRAAIREAIARGLPTYAECGGLMYLCKKIVDSEGKAYPMVGAIDAVCKMTDRLVNFGYAEVLALRDTILARRGERARGHEFHYSRVEHHDSHRRAAYLVISSRNRKEGFVRRNLVASYVHLHFFRCRRWAERFIRSCAAFRNRHL